MLGKENAKVYLSNMSGAIGHLLVLKDGLYSGRNGHERFARECGYALNDFDEYGKELILRRSYADLYVPGCYKRPILTEAEWTGIMRSRIK